MKFSIPNFGVALLKLADPFCVCDGTYESPTRAINQSLAEAKDHSSLLHVNEDIKNIKIAVLKAIALRECLFWGFCTNMSLVSLVLASSSRLDEFKSLDIILSSFIIASSFGAAACCFVFTKYSARVVDEQITTGETNFIPIPLRKQDKEGAVNENNV